MRVQQVGPQIPYEKGALTDYYVSVPKFSTILHRSAVWNSWLNCGSTEGIADCILLGLCSCSSRGSALPCEYLLPFNSKFEPTLCQIKLDPLGGFKPQLALPKSALREKRHGPSLCQISSTVAIRPLTQPGHQEDRTCLLRRDEMARAEEGIHRPEPRKWVFVP